MPRRSLTAPAKPAVVTSVKTLKAVAQEYGVKNDTVTGWKKEGMPGKSGNWPLVEIYLWGKAKGYKLELPRNEAARRLIGAVERRRPDPETAAAQAVAAGVNKQLVELGRLVGISVPDESELDERDRPLAWKRWADSVKASYDVLREQEHLIPRAAVAARLESLRNRVMDHLADVQRVAQVIPRLDHDQREAMREALREWTYEAQAAMSGREK